MPIPPGDGPLAVRAVGIPWYRRSDYGRILRVMADAHLLPRAHADWLRRAEATEQQIKAQGRIAERVYLDPRGFADWCRARGLDVDAEARRRFVSAIIAERHRDRS